MINRRNVKNPPDFSLQYYIAVRNRKTELILSSRSVGGCVGSSGGGRCLRGRVQLAAGPGVQVETWRGGGGDSGYGGSGDAAELARAEVAAVVAVAAMAGVPGKVAIETGGEEGMALAEVARAGVVRAKVAREVGVGAEGGRRGRKGRGRVEGGMIEGGDGGGEGLELE